MSIIFNVLPKETQSMWTRDRVRLDADVYRPDAEGEFPVLLMRQPYGREIASTVVYAHPIWYAAQGYIVVIQDVRGRGTSEGEFKLFESEIEDGYDAVEWAARLPGSTGEVGMYGFSYQGMTQLYAAIAQPPALKAICPAMIGFDLYEDWAYENGAFCLQANLGWGIQIAAETARLKGDAESHRLLAIAAKNLPLSDAVPTRSSILTNLAPDCFYHTWLEHDTPDEYWRNLSPKTYLDKLNLPMLHIGGWFDTFMRGTIHLYQAMVAKGAPDQKLIVGPWAHIPWSRKVGGIDFGEMANSPCDRAQIRWFNHFLKRQQSGFSAEYPLQLFMMGANDWFYYPNWNDDPAIAYALESTGLAGMNDQDGKLVPSDLRSLEDDRSPTTPDVLVHDPWRPVPALGGHASYPSGPQERSQLDGRSDVLTYTTAPLPEPLHLMGDVIVSLDCESDSPSFDLSAVLSEVRPNGTVYNFTQGYIHVKPGQKTRPLSFSLQPTCMQVKAGHAIRLSLSPACFPAYPVNPGTGQRVSEAKRFDQQIITIRIHPATSHIRLSGIVPQPG
jgi:putative CocE/NonD family hydrolase